MTTIRDYLSFFLPVGATQAILEANVGGIYYENNPTLRLGIDELVNRELGGAILYHVNGLNVFPRSDTFGVPDSPPASKFEAFEEAESISLELARSVQLIYNDTAQTRPGDNVGFAADVAQAALDAVWVAPLPQHNETTKHLAGLLLQHARNKENVSISGYLQGTLIVRNALRTLIDLGEGAWVANHVKLLFVGTPLNTNDVKGMHGVFLNNTRDPVAALGNATNGQGPNGLTGFTRETNLYRRNHNLVISYVKQYNLGFFYPANNCLKPYSVDSGSVTEALSALIDGEERLKRLEVYEPYLLGDIFDDTFVGPPF